MDPALAAQVARDGGGRTVDRELNWRGGEIIGGEHCLSVNEGRCLHSNAPSPHYSPLVQSHCSPHTRPAFPQSSHERGMETLGQRELK